MAGVAGVWLRLARLPPVEHEGDAMTYEFAGFRFDPERGLDRGGRRIRRG